MEFAFGAAAAVGAGFFTNPIDVIKTRLQVQGELEARGTYRKVYRNTFHAAYVIARREGIWALQAGIVPALGFQLVLNGIRIGAYNLAKKYEITADSSGQTYVFRSIVVSALTGCFGSAFASPLYLVKTQLQSQPVGSQPIGKYHGHTSTYSAFRAHWRSGGLRALYRGWYVGAPRISCGSAAQLTSYSIALDWLNPLQMFAGKPIFLTFVASLISGTFVALTMQPFDVIATRVYNQKTDALGRGVFYKGFFDATFKIFKTEGFTGLYKGVFPAWLRAAPHTVLCLVFYEKIDQYYTENFS